MVQWSVLLGLVEISSDVQLLAEIGACLLLFEVGLETNIRELARVGVASLLVALVWITALAAVFRLLFRIPLPS